MADKLESGLLKLSEVIKIFSQIAPALEKAHSRNIVHRDLKPGNILFDEDGRAHLADFGIAILIEGSAKLTGSGIIGTPAYMSPEQARADKTMDGRSDIYALGVILFEMLTGKLPYEADTAIAIVLKHLNEPVPDILVANPKLPAGIGPVLQKAMAKAATDHYSNAPDFDRVLRAVTVKEIIDKPKTKKQITATEVLDESKPQPEPILRTETLAGEEKKAKVRTQCEAAELAQSDKPAKKQILEKLPERMTIKDMEFCRVPAGPFLMGSDDKKHNEKPQHTVDIPYDYWLGRYTVTNEQYNSFVGAEGGKHPVRNWQKKRNHPVTKVSWRSAKEYCVWLNDSINGEQPVGLVLRLPTEAEWEKGARRHKWAYLPVGGMHLRKISVIPENYLEVPVRWVPFRRRATALPAWQI